jgi:hypothetical protein
LAQHHEKVQTCSSAGKTGFGRNGRQTKSSPERGNLCTSKGLLLLLVVLPGFKYVVTWSKILDSQACFIRPLYEAPKATITIVVK